MICTSSGSGSSGTVVRSRSPKKPCQTRPNDVMKVHHQTHHEETRNMHNMCNIICN
jgi:hypothetical protein